MDTTIIRLTIALLVIAAAVTINFFAVSMADHSRGKIIVLGVASGWIGLLLTLLVMFWPIIVLLTYMAGNADGTAKLFMPLIVGACTCTFVSLSVLLASYFCAIGRET